VNSGACIGHLALSQNIAGPYLVVVPLSTVPNWIREFRKWLPQVNALVYVGDSKSREVPVQAPSPCPALLSSAIVQTFARLPGCCPKCPFLVVQSPLACSLMACSMLIGGSVVKHECAAQL
jgi:hypothetical protein